MSEDKKSKRKPANRSRTEMIRLRLTKEEKEKLKSTANNAGMNVTEFVMSMVDNGQVNVFPGAAELRTELLHEGNNLNQAVRLFRLNKLDTQNIETAALAIKTATEKLVNLISDWQVSVTPIEKVGVVNADNQDQKQQGESE